MRNRSMRTFGNILVLAVFVCAPASVATADPFHFTVTADPRDYHTTFGNVLGAINAKVGGMGAFHVIAGDFDNTIPDNRAVIDSYFGPSALWYPVIGNHESETEDETAWLRAEYNTGNGVRTPLKNFTLQNGPAGCVETTYSWNYGGAHFVAINEYWNGGTAAGSDRASDGDVVAQLRTWLSNDLAANAGKPIFVIGHEPAFVPAGHNHYGNSLDLHPANRDAFWAILETNKVAAYINGHTHDYFSWKGDANHVGNVWQFDAGNAGNNNMGDGQTFFNIVVDGSQVQLQVWRNNNTSTFTMDESFNLQPEPATLTMLAIGGLFVALRRKTR